MVLIYCNPTTSRVRYVARFLLTDILGVPVEFTSDKEVFLQHRGPAVNYSNEQLNVFTINPCRLLSETGVKQFSVPVSSIDGLPVLFPANHPNNFPFDVFAASFYMITRYEEYLDQPLDVYGRAITENSLAFKNGFLEIPVVDLWAYKLGKAIEDNFPGYVFPQRVYSHIPTIDVDIVWAYRNRGFFRLAGAVAKSFIKFDFADNLQRFRTLVLGAPDPFDQFSLLDSWYAEFNLQPIFFFLVGKYGQFDKNISPDNAAMRRFTYNMGGKYNIGLHPSYASNLFSERVGEEVANLREITGKEVVRSRQHFLKLRFPETYQLLIANGIMEDYTMGYAGQPGFRAGTCTSFPFFDLTTETETSLRVIPFQVMDGTLTEYLKLSPEGAMARCRAIISEIKKVNGTFVTLWHNGSLSEMRGSKGWRSFYYKLLEAAR